MGANELLVKLVGLTQQRSKEWQSPSIWYGCTLAGWLSLLVRNGFAVTPSQWPKAAGITAMSTLNSTLGLAERAVYGRRVAQVELEPPIFIIGHWRTGTTLLHELLALDSRHSIPNTYECFIPNHFLLTEDFALNSLGDLLPPTRPMDNMQIGLDRPFEDEFALMNMGLPSPYLHLAFPDRNHHRRYLGLEHLNLLDRARWKRNLVRFMKRVALRRPGRVILKTPPHSSRIPTLLELFPEARFIHTVRNPYDVFPSTVNLWRKVATLFALEKPRFDSLEDFVFAVGDDLYQTLDRHRGQIPEGHYAEVAFEDLTSRPAEVLESLYQDLGLGDYARVRPAVDEYVAQLTDYQRNRFVLPEEQRRRIRHEWGWLFSRYGYDPEDWGPYERRHSERRH